MPYADNDGTSIYYEVIGEDSAEPVILIEGFTAQLIGWRPTLVAKFVGQGLRVVLMDNRDVGLSDKLGGPHDVERAYTIADMARDVVAVADDLGLERFHVAGQSMGGMIAQAVLAEVPHRVCSATLFYTTPASGNARYMRDPDGAQVGIGRHPDRASAIEAFVARERVAGSPAYPFDEAWVRELATKSYDRCYEPSGFIRQWKAIEDFSAGVADRLRHLETPVTIFHGLDDAHILPAAAIDLHLILRNSELHLFPGMGHELVEPLWDEFAAGLARAVRRGAATTPRRNQGSSAKCVDITTID
ncbi:alpha/beta fold hydrolase [Microbacterium album]|uniref:Hydrolase n=1 Tax=Microbacterium album TaxID=2053191 RepID=A0A917MMQ6_9MICO|nr:alpha/beta hydrolase [Microbacterium album]GGH48560.1 hydrolase [Microbacterium album]